MGSVRSMTMDLHGIRQYAFAEWLKKTKSRVTLFMISIKKIHAVITPLKIRRLVIFLFVVYMIIVFALLGAAFTAMPWESFR